MFSNRIIDQTIKTFFFIKLANSNIKSLHYGTNRTAQATLNAETCDDETAEFIL